MKRDRVLRYALPAGVVALVAALTLLLLYNEPLRRAILDPVTWAVSDIRRSLAALPQALLWAIGLLLGCAVLLVSWRRALRDADSPPARPRPATVRPDNENTVAGLARDLRRAKRRHVSRTRVAGELSMLAERLIARRKGVPIQEARSMIQSGQWPDDPDIRRFFASRRGESTVPKEQFIEVVETTLAFLDRYHQEV